MCATAPRPPTARGRVCGTPGRTETSSSAVCTTPSRWVGGAGQRDVQVAPPRGEPERISAGSRQGRAGAPIGRRHARRRRRSRPGRRGSSGLRCPGSVSQEGPDLGVVSAALAEPGDEGAAEPVWGAVELAAWPTASTTWVMPKSVRVPHWPVHSGPGSPPRSSNQAVRRVRALAGNCQLLSTGRRRYLLAPGRRGYGATQRGQSRNRTVPAILHMTRGRVAWT